MKTNSLRVVAVVAPLLLAGPMTAVPASARTYSAPNVQLVNRQTSKCLTIAGGISTDNNVAAVQFTCDSHLSRRWDVFGVTIGWLVIKNRQTGKCLTIAGGTSSDNNVLAVQFTCDGHPSRFWKIRE